MDDQPTVRKALSLILRRLGFTDLVEAEDGYEALSLLKKTEFNLIISDVHMPAPLPGVPAKSGIDLLEAVRLDSDLKGIPFLIVSTDSEMKTVVKAMQSGVNGYIIKPFTEKAVKEKLEMLKFKIREPKDLPEPAPKPEPVVAPADKSADDDFLRTTF